mmetsp:Transcript_66497/g.138878  ORF Transcript_66497/g.138878 Transcript_66497/m.138878 type:complete len:200 (+) Transcript_66497:71-670(+)
MRYFRPSIRTWVQSGLCFHHRTAMHHRSPLLFRTGGTRLGWRWITRWHSWRSKKRPKVSASGLCGSVQLGCTKPFCNDFRRAQIVLSTSGGTTSTQQVSGSQAERGFDPCRTRDGASISSPSPRQTSRGPILTTWPRTMRLNSLWLCHTGCRSDLVQSVGRSWLISPTPGKRMGSWKTRTSWQGMMHSAESGWMHPTYQ